MSDVARAAAAAPPADRPIELRAILHGLAVVLAGGWTGYFLFTGMPQLTLEVFPRTLALHLVVAGAALLYALYLAVARRLPGGTPFDVPVLAFIAAYALATVASASWRVSLDATLQIGVAVMAFYALTDLPYLSARALLRAFLLTGAALSLYALWVVGNDYADYLRFTRSVEGLDSGNIFPPTVPRVHGVSDHPNVLAMILTLVMPLLALAAYRAPSRAERWGAGAALLVAGMAIFLTLSRGGWIGAAAGIVFTLAATWVTVRATEREERGEPFSWETVFPRDVSPTALAALAGAIVLVAGGTLAYLANSSTRPGWLFRSSLSPREDAWESGLDMFGDHPLLGAGPNTFGLLYPEYSGEFLVHTQHAHNGFLQVADDAGIAGLLALLGLGLATAYVLYRTWRAGTLEQRLIAVGCAGALAGFSVHNQLDAGNIWKGPGIALAVVGAVMARNFLEATRDETRDVVPDLFARPRRLAGLGARAALLALLILPFAAWYRIDDGHHDYWLGMERLAHGRPGAIEALQRAVDQDSSMMVYQLQLGQAQASIYQAAREKDGFLIDAAIIHLEEAVRLDRRSDLAHANLARAYQLAGRDDDAAAEAAKTRFIASHHVAPVLMAGEVYEDLRREQEAVETYGQVISMDAGLADSTFWQGTAFRRERFGEILKRSALGINPCTFGAYLVQAHRSDPDAPLDELDEASAGCQLMVFSLPNDLVLRVAYAKVLMEQGRADDAFAHLAYAVDRQPDFGPARTEMGRWSAARGDLDAARHEWVVGAELDEAESVLLLGDSYPAGEVPGDVPGRLRELLATSGSSIRNDLISILYYRMRYGRASPLVALIPGDWNEAVPRLYGQMQDALARWESEEGGSASAE